MTNRAARGPQTRSRPAAPSISALRAQLPQHTASIAALAAAHLVSTWVVLLALRGGMIPVTRLTATIGYALLGPVTFWFGNAMLREGLPQLAGQWSGPIIATPANSLLSAITLYAMWASAKAVWRTIA